MKKVREKFGGKKKTPYLCTRLQEQGRLAQLVQSICLTSRGSAVRIRQRPHKTDNTKVLSVFFLYAHSCHDFAACVCCLSGIYKNAIYNKLLLSVSAIKSI